MLQRWPIPHRLKPNRIRRCLIGKRDLSRSGRYTWSHFFSYHAPTECKKWFVILPMRGAAVSCIGGFVLRWVGSDKMSMNICWCNVISAGWMLQRYQIWYSGCENVRICTRSGWEGSMLSIRMTLDAFVELRKATMSSFVLSLYSSVRLHGTNRLPLDGFWWCFIFEPFFRKPVEKIQVSLVLDKNNEYFTWRRFGIYGNISPNSS